MALGGSKFTSFESDTCHPSYSSVSYVDLPKRTPREPKIRNERNSHPIGRKNASETIFGQGFSVSCWNFYQILKNISFTNVFASGAPSKILKNADQPFLIMLGIPLKHALQNWG